MNEGNPTSDKWYWSKQGSDERNGPVSDEKLKELAEKGDLEPDDLVWTQGMDDWEEASSVEGVKDFFESPPPLPKEPAEQGGTQQETPPPLSQGEKPEAEEEDAGVESKASEPEALSCIHDYDENRVCRRCGWSKSELKKIDTDGSEEAEDTDGPEEAEDTDGSEEAEDTDGSEEAEDTDGSEEEEGFGGCAVLALLLLLAPFVANYYWDYSWTSYFENNRKEAVAGILDEEGTKGSLEKAKKYETAFKDLEKNNERLEDILDSLRVERIRSIESSVYVGESEKSIYDKIDMLEKAKRMQKEIYNIGVGSVMQGVRSKYEYLTKVSEYGGFDEMKDEAKDLCSEKTDEESSWAAAGIDADLWDTEAKKVSKFAYKVEGTIKLEDGTTTRSFAGSATCRVSWRSGVPKITYFDTD